MKTVTVKCPTCKATREIQAGEIQKNDMPMCDKCFMPMIPQLATMKND